MGKMTEDDFLKEGLDDDEIAAMEAEDNSAEPVIDDADQDLEDAATEPQEPSAPEAPKEQPGNSREVPLQALQEARSENRELRATMARLEERTNIMLQQMQQRKPEEPEIKPPSVEDDPLGYYDYQIREANKRADDLQKQFETMQQGQQKQSEQAKAYQADLSAINRADVALTQSIENDPELKSMAEWLVGGIHQAAINQARGNEEAAQLYYTQMMADQARSALSDPKGVGAYLKRAAVFLGYEKPEQQPAQPNGAERIQSLQDKATRHMSLSDAGGGEAARELTAADLGRMTDKEFQAWLSKPGNDAKFDKLAGG